MTIAGAGALGLVTALRLADAGASVTVCDPAPLGDNASGVAAGMLAPAFECLLDPVAADHFARLSAARDLWPALARRIGLEHALDRSGAVLVGFAGETERLTDLEARAVGLGLTPSRWTAAQLQSYLPGLAAGATSGLFTGEDWRLEPLSALLAAAAALQEAGGRIVAESLEVRDGRLGLDGTPIVGAVVLAVGSEAGDLATLAPELAALVPVKGQILRFEGGPRSGPVVRSLRGYLAPQPDGALAGATMEAGRRDRELDPAVMARLRTEAASLFPGLAALPATGRAGVRAATPDGLPLVGRSDGPGGSEVILCTGARRNGWLLAPLAAEAVLKALTGEGADPAFAPSRFA